MCFVLHWMFYTPKKGKNKRRFSMKFVCVPFVCMCVCWFVPFGKTHLTFTFTMTQINHLPGCTREVHTDIYRYRDILWGSRFLCFHTNLHTNSIVFALTFTIQLFLCVRLRLGVSADITTSMLSYCIHTALSFLHTVKHLFSLLCFFA